MTIKTTREQRRQLERDNSKLPVTLQEIPREQWPNPNAPQRRIWRSRDFLVQEYSEPYPAIARLSICRTVIVGKTWQGDIPWDDLQRLKSECGYGDKDAVEVYPADIDVVNVANMRHLWIMETPLAFAWRYTTPT